jgi:hypothetical protein
MQDYYKLGYDGGYNPEHMRCFIMLSADTSAQDRANYLTGYLRGVQEWDQKNETITNKRT